MRVNTVSDKHDKLSFKSYSNPLLRNFNTSHVNAFRDAKAAITATADEVDITMLPAIRIACKKTIFSTFTCHTEQKTLKPRMFVNNAIGSMKAYIYSYLTILRGFDADISSHAIAVVKQNEKTFQQYKPFEPKKLHAVQVLSSPLEEFYGSEYAISQHFQQLARQAKEAFFRDKKVVKETSRLKKLFNDRFANDKHAEAIRKYNEA